MTRLGAAGGSVGKKIVIAAVLLAPVVMGTALAGAGSRSAAPARWPGCPGTAPVIRPASYILACGDGNARFQNLTWSSWGPREAEGTGQYLYSDCVPDCALGTTHYKTVSVWLGRPRDGGHQGHRYWTRLTIRFIGSKPAKARWVEHLRWSRGFWRF